jgi:hypothetical protein
MNHFVKHCQTISTAKQAGFMPSYWLAISLGNDREPGRLGSVEDRVT